MLSLITLSLCCFITYAFPEASIQGEVVTAKRRCAGGYLDGEQVEMGRYWYECRDGELASKGCISDDKRRIAVGDTYDSNGSYRMQCVLDSNGSVAFAYKACVVDDAERNPGESWDDGKYWYTCKRKGEFLHIILSGCISDGKRVEANQKVTKGSFVYQCKRTSNGTCSMCPVACAKNGREYSIGDTFEVGDYVFTCTNSRGPISVKVIGCFHDNQRLQDGDHYFKDDVIMECSVREDEADVKPVGCIQRKDNGSFVERRLGCYWSEGVLPYHYEMTCKYDDDSKTAVKVPFRCMYKIPRGTYTIDPGCYQIADTTVISCEKDESGALSMRASQIDDIGKLTAKGLRFC